MFENKTIGGYIHETRFIASWLRKGGKLKTGKDVNNFCKWLLSMGLTTEEAEHIRFLATNGKLELEKSAEKFIKEHDC